MRRGLLVLAVAGLSGCPLTDDGGAVDGPTDAGPTGPGPGWVLRPHPCLGRTSEALHRAADGAIYVGCGTGADGKGLWRTRNDGLTWGPVGALESWRINDVQPAPDGGLFVAGIDTTSRAAVGHLDADDTLTVVYERGVVVSSSFHVGHFGQLDSGEALAESLTGAPVVYRDDPEHLFRPIDRWASDGESHQILSMVNDGAAFYAAGSTITEPPTVFLPLPGGAEGDTLLVSVKPFPAGTQGELWGIAVDGDRVLAVGVDQDADRGLVAVGPTDGYNVEAWTLPDAAAGIEGGSWFRGACLRGDHLVVLGERQPWRRGGGIVLESTDGGATWADAAPDTDAQAWHRCHLAADGRLFLAGVNGQFAIRTP